MSNAHFTNVKIKNFKRFDSIELTYLEALLRIANRKSN